MNKDCIEELSMSGFLIDKIEELSTIRDKRLDKLLTTEKKLSNANESHVKEPAEKKWKYILELRRIHKMQFDKYTKTKTDLIKNIDLALKAMDRHNTKKTKENNNENRP